MSKYKLTLNQHVQVNYGMRLSKFGTDEMTALFKKPGTKKLNVAAGKIVSAYWEVFKADNPVKKDPKFNDVKGLMSLLIFDSFVDACVKLFFPETTAAGEKNQYDQLAKVSVPDTIRALPKSTRTVLKKWFSDRKPGKNIQIYIYAKICSFSSSSSSSCSPFFFPRFYFISYILMYELFLQS